MNWLPKQGFVNADSLEDFIDKFYKKHKIYDESYRKELIKSKEKELIEFGFASISRHESVVGSMVHFKLKSNNL